MRKFLSRLFLALGLTGASFVFLFSPWGQDLERVSYDSLFLFRGNRADAKNIILVGIDEASFDMLDLRWPWPRSTHAELINKLSEAGTKVIGFDLLFTEPSTLEQDTSLAQAIDSHGGVVLASELSKEYSSQLYDPEGTKKVDIIEKISRPIPIMDLAENEIQTGLVQVKLDADGFIRKFLCSQKEMSSFSMKIASMYSGKEYSCQNLEKKINFNGPVQTIRTISYAQVLSLSAGEIAKVFKDKIALVGFVISSKASLKKEDSKDHFPIPFSRIGGVNSNGLMPGVEIHANAVENFLNDSFIKELNQNYIIGLGFFLGVIGGTLLFFLLPFAGIIIFVSLSALFAGICLYLFNFHNTYFSLPNSFFPFAVCYVASPLFHYLTANKERAFIKKAFSTYLNPRLVAQLIQSPDKLELGGEEREATVMFADLVGFTSLSETLSPKELVSFVNKYLGAFADEIFKHDGMVDKYIGDCIMAVWGVPLADAGHAKKACDTALAMKNKLLELNKSSQKEISFRIGIATGQMLAGNVGGGTQFNYTVLGNDVNLASRIESLNKFYGTMILVNERTKKSLPEDLLSREVDIVRVKGQERAERLFEIYGIRDKLEPSVLSGFETYYQAKKLYSEKKWKEAQQAFEKVFEFLPNDSPSNVLIKRCQEFIANPPEGDWDGVYVMTEK